MATVKRSKKISKSKHGEFVKMMPPAAVKLCTMREIWAKHGLTYHQCRYILGGPLCESTGDKGYYRAKAQ